MASLANLTRFGGDADFVLHLRQWFYEDSEDSEGLEQDSDPLRM